MEKEPYDRKALIYCRVSTKKQLKGSGLDSQEHRCRQYCDAKNYAVEAVFSDDKSGGGDFMKRPGMVALLKYLEAKPQERYVVVFDDLRRYSRDIEFHFQLRRIMEERNADRECLNFNFENSPEGLLHEGMVSLTGHYERLVNSRQNRQKSIARLEQGYCVQAVPPVGYCYEEQKAGGKLLVRDEPDASVVEHTLNCFADGHFASGAEVTRYVNEHPTFPTRNPSKHLTHHTVVKMLRQKLYAGLVGSETFGVSTREGRHKGLISVEAFQKIQAKLDKPNYAAPRKDIAEDFPLRTGVCCATCMRPLTGGWSKGKYKRYPYMFCWNRLCPDYGKTIPRAKIEGEFEELLSRVQPTRKLVDVVSAMFRDEWALQEKHARVLADAIKRDLRKIEDKISQTVDSLVEATNARVISAYERRIEQLELDKLAMLEKQREMGKAQHDFGELLELSLRFLSKPCNIWKTGDFKLKQLVLRLVFLEHIPYSKKTGFRTPAFSQPFNVFNELGGSFAPVKKMVPRERIELSTSSLPMMRSTTELPRRLKRVSEGLSLCRE